MYDRTKWAWLNITSERTRNQLCWALADSQRAGRGAHRKANHGTELLVGARWKGRSRIRQRTKYDVSEAALQRASGCHNIKKISTSAAVLGQLHF